MENNLEPKALSDLIKNPAEISSIINDPASGLNFFQALPSKDKQYVAFAAGIGLLAYGLFLNRKSQREAAPNSLGNQPSGTQTPDKPASNTSPSDQTLAVKKNKK